MTINKVIMNWLRTRILQNKLHVKSSDIETELVKYAKDYWNVMHTPSTWSRGWRKFREEEHFKKIDIVNIQPIKTQSRQTTWEIQT